MRYKSTDYLISPNLKMDLLFSLFWNSVTDVTTLFLLFVFSEEEGIFLFSSSLFPYWIRGNRNEPNIPPFLSRTLSHILIQQTCVFPPLVFITHLLFHLVFLNFNYRSNRDCYLYQWPTEETPTHRYEMAIEKNVLVIIVRCCLKERMRKRKLFCHNVFKRYNDLRLP